MRTASDSAAPVRDRIESAARGQSMSARECHSNALAAGFDGIPARVNGAPGGTRRPRPWRRRHRGGVVPFSHDGAEVPRCDGVVIRASFTCDGHGLRRADVCSMPMPVPRVAAITGDGRIENVGILGMRVDECGRERTGDNDGLSLRPKCVKDAAEEPGSDPPAPGSWEHGCRQQCDADTRLRLATRDSSRWSSHGTASNPVHVGAQDQMIELGGLIRRSIRER